MKEKSIKPCRNNSNLYEFEQLFWQNNQVICGIDEVGRGCLAGPVVAAAVILHAYAINTDIKDSKLLRPSQIENIHQWIIKNSFYAIATSNARMIDHYNIYKATQMTMKKALFHLIHAQKVPLPDTIAIDAMPLSLTDTAYGSIPIQSFIKGESKSASIAAASIVAKYTRDTMMKKMHTSFPAYKLDAHKGYGTALHSAALQEYRDCIMHRKTFIKKFKGSDYDDHRQKNLFC